MLKSTPSPLLALTLALLLSACDSAPTDTHPDQPVSKRKAVFKQMMRTLEPMGMVARNRQDYQQQEFLASALELQQLSTQPWVHFTPDSNYPPTRAKAEVWQKPAEFRQAQQDLQSATERLVKAARSGNPDLVRPAVNEVEKSCKACHNQFRGGS